MPLVVIGARSNIEFINSKIGGSGNQSTQDRYFAFI